MIDLVVNGARHRLDADPAMPLLYALIDGLKLNGAKYGCGLGQCGACTVLLDGRPIYSCLTPIAAVGDREVTTVEGLSDSDGLRAAFETEQAAQCGYCIPGMIMRAKGTFAGAPSPSELDLREALAGHLCRCGTHMRILRAIRRGLSGRDAEAADTLRATR